MKKKLFFICPECCTEHLIRDRFEGELYFLTSLGAIVHPDRFDYTDSIYQVVQQYDIEEIGILSKSDCTFVKEAISHKYAGSSFATDYLSKLFQDNIMDIPLKGDIHEIRYSLAEINAIEQCRVLESAPQLQERIASGRLQIKGYAYNSATQELNEVTVNTRV